MLELTVLNGCRTLQLTRGMNTLIDEADLPIVAGVRWFATTCAGYVYAGRTDCLTSGSRNRKYRGRRLHREVTGARPGQRVDHRDGDTLNNTRSNLRIATQAENGRNQHRTRGASRFKGVQIDRRRGGWRAVIVVSGKRIWLGQFPTEGAAARAYDRAAALHFGEFAKTNTEIHGDY